VARKMTAWMLRARGGAWWTVLAILLFAGAGEALGQDAVNPPQARSALKQGYDLYRRGDYEQAGKYFARAQALQQELTAAERRDLANYISRNNTALQLRRDGQLQLTKAQDALRQGRTREAADLIMIANANEYLTPQDRNLLTKLNESVRTTRTGAAMPAVPGNASYKSLLSQARMALQQGDIDQAESLAHEAERVHSGPTWMHLPWSDSPAKVIRDAQSTRRKLMQEAMKSNAPKDVSPLKGIKKFFRFNKEPDQQEYFGPGPILNSPSSPRAGNQKTSDGRNGQYHDFLAEKTPRGSNSSDNTTQARLLIQKGYEALRAKDYETARKYAFQAKELRPNLTFSEQNPDSLLTAIQQASATASRTSSSGPIIQASASSPAPAEAYKDPHVLLREARAALNQNKLDEAEQLCARAAGQPDAHWGYFEDSPAKLRVDIQKKRTRQDREKSVELLAEARKLFAQGRYDEARNLAWRAQQLHGTYNVWELGDRPQKLLSEIEKAQQKAVQTSGKMQESMARPYNPVVGPANAKQRARELLAEARQLQSRGLLIEARAKISAAQQLGGQFSPLENGPDIVMRDLNALCARQIDMLVQRANTALSNAADSTRVRKAEADLATARSLAVAFGQDLGRIDQAVATLRQAQLNGGIVLASAVGTPTPAGPMPASNLNSETPIPAAAAPNSAGKDLLDRARLELKAGNTHMARRIAEEAFDAKYGVQREAQAMLRSIDTEEHNQTVLAARRSAEAAVDAYRRKDFKSARSIFVALDIRLLSPEMQRLVREISAQPEMQPEGAQRVAAKENFGVVPAIDIPGKALVSDQAPSGSKGGIEEYRAMEEIAFQKLHKKSLEVQAKAIEAMRAGNSARAIDMLREHMDQLSRSPIDPERVGILRKQVAKRLEQCQIAQAQRQALEQSQQSIHNEGKYQQAILKHQQQVEDLLRQYRNLMKEGKANEAHVAALKAKEVAPDNPAVVAAVYISDVRMKQDRDDKIRHENEKRFLDGVDGNGGAFVSMEDPLSIDPKRLEISKKRSVLQNGIWSTIKNPKERAIERKLSSLVSLNFKDTPLKQVIYDLQTMTGVNIYPDSAALQEANISLEQPLSLSVDNISFKSALRLLLRQVHLTYVIKDEVLQITTENRSKGNTVRVVYPVADLVVPVEDNPTPDSMNLQAIMDRHVHQMSGVSNPGLTPFPGPMSLPNGQTVSSSSSGVSGAGAYQGNMSSGGSMVTRQSVKQTIEDTLINLITSTISPETWQSAGGPGQIQYFPLGLALVVNQTQDVQEQVLDLLQALRRLQDLEVAIEMRMITVSEAFFEFIGVNFDLNLLTHNSQADQNLVLNSSFQPFGLPNAFKPSRFVTGLTPAGTFTPDLNVPIKASSFGFSQPPFGGFPGTLGADGGISMGLAFLSDIQVFMFMEAAQGDRRTNVMQAPKITVFNGQTAFITVSDQQFFLTGVNVFQSPFGQVFFNPIQTPFPLGVSLRVTPVVSADRRFVRLNLFPSMTNLASTNVPLIPVQIPVPTFLFGPGPNTTIGPPENIVQMFFQQPAFTTIFLNTTVNVPDGGTVLLGGLKTLSEGRNEFGPPILSKIPYISRLFRNTAYGREAQSLMIMVTPRIIINEEEELIYTGQLPSIPRP
jgi:type II secretory pathway component GspD/PulD (secretin)/tetratricopeptide (TPR) repeat protein